MAQDLHPIFSDAIYFPNEFVLRWNAREREREKEGEGSKDERKAFTENKFLIKKDHFIIQEV